MFRSNPLEGRAAVPTPWSAVAACSRGNGCKHAAYRAHLLPEEDNPRPTGADEVEAHILLADDDTVLSDLLSRYLRQAGLRVTQTFDGAAAVTHAVSDAYDLIVLDVMLPRLDGFEALRAIRARVQTPVLMLTARGEDIDRILGLEMGADDYLPKPCNPRELLARIRAILRRSAGGPAASQPEAITCGDLTLATGDRSVRIGGQLVALTSTEFTVLASLVRQAGTVVSKEALSEQALGRKLGPYDRSLDMHISNLRKKLGPLRQSTPRIKTVRGVGYLYVTGEDGSACVPSS
jgi:DNA-binding response OmpR family regulator